MKFKQVSKNLFFVPIAAGALLCSCITSTDEDSKNTNKVEPESSFTYNSDGNVSFFDATYEEDADFDDTEFKNKITINFNGSEAPTIEPAKTDGVTIITNEEKGSAHLIIKSEKKINYILKGSSDNGSLMIFSQKKFKLTLDNLTLSNDAGLPAISSQTKKRCFVETVGTVNIKDAPAYSLGDAYKKSEEELYDAKGAIFSEGELIFVGNGTLNVTGRCKHAICSDQYVRISSGIVNVIGAKKDGIHTNDAVLIYGGTVNISGIVGDKNVSAKKLNGIECEKGYIVIKGGKVTIESPGIGIYASKEDFKKSDAMTEKSFIYIDGGEITIATNESKGHGISANSHLIIKGDNTVVSIKALGDGAKGLKTGSNLVENKNDLEEGQIVFAGGTVNLFSVDKVLDPEDSLFIWGGTLNAVGDDCVVREKIKGSQLCAIASFNVGVKAGEEIKVGDKSIDLMPATLTNRAKIMLSNSNLSADAVPEISIGSRTVKAELISK